MHLGQACPPGGEEPDWTHEASRSSVHSPVWELGHCHQVLGKVDVQSPTLQRGCEVLVRSHI